MAQPPHGPLPEWDARLRVLSDLTAELLQSLRDGKADPELAEKFLGVWKETVRAETILDLRREADRERQENQMLMDISLKLSSSSAIEDVLRTILDSLRQVVDFAAAGIFVYNRELGQIELDMQSGEEVESEKIYRKFQEAVKLGVGILGSVIVSGRPVYVPDVHQDNRYVEVRPTTRSELCVPITARGEVIGAFNLEADRLDAFSERDLRLLTIFAAHAGVAIERARSDRMRFHTRRIQEEVELARRIQTLFLPTSVPSFAPYDLAGANFSSGEVGGDYFDFIPITETDLGVAIGDVTGHGMAAALLMTNFRACLRIESRNNFAIRTILDKVNDYLYETNIPDSFVTAVYGVLDRRNHVFSYANAGHNPPFVLRRDGRIDSLQVGGLLMGAFPRVTYEETAIPLRPGDILVMYTDGITEALDASGRHFGIDRLRKLVKQFRHLPASDIVREITTRVRDFQSDLQPQDDLTVSIIKYA